MTVKYKSYTERVADNQYQNMLRHIFKTGRDVKPFQAHLLEDEETDEIKNAYARMVSGHILRFNMENGFPLITERDMSGKFLTAALGEHIGFLNGARTHKELEKYGCHYWHRWVTKEKCELFGLEEGDLGPGSYGAAWANFPTKEGAPINQIQNIIDQIQKYPYARTHVISPWIPQYIVAGDHNKRKVVVAPCHGWIHVQVFPDKKEVSIVHWQRSGDTPVGVAFNMVQYAAFGMMLAQVINYTFTEYVHFLSDAHMYHGQFGAVKELISRKPKPFPTMTLDPSIKNIFDFRPEHFTLTDYAPHEAMKIWTPV